jgi:hypothetical protein
LVTPEIAKSWLGMNHVNRKLFEPVVERLTGIIHRGEWMPDCTDGIGLDVDEGVINGQHRLTAILNSGVPCWCLVVRNVRPEVIKVIDQGRGRTFTQWLQMQGNVSNATTVALGVEYLYKTNGGWEQAMPTAFKPTIPQLLDVFMEHRNIEYSASPAMEAYNKVGCPTRGILTAYHYLMATVDPELADEFFIGLTTGIDLGERDPVRALRERYLRENAKDRAARQSNAQLSAWLVKAWEAKRQGIEVTERQLNWISEGRRREPFPKVSGLPWDVVASGIEPDAEDDTDDDDLAEDSDD